MRCKDRPGVRTTLHRMRSLTAAAPTVTSAVPSSVVTGSLHACPPTGLYCRGCPTPRETAMTRRPLSAILFLVSASSLSAAEDAAPARLGPGGFVHVSTITCVAFSPDGKAVAVGCQDGVPCVWDVATATRRPPPEGAPRGVYA